MNKLQLILLGIGAVAIGAWLLFGDQLKTKIAQEVFKLNDTTTEQTNEEVSSEPEIIATGLTVPWEIAFLPNGDMLVTERSGTLKLFGNTNIEFPISGVRPMGEGGLLGLAIHPNFSQNHFVYLYFTTTNATNKVVRYRLTHNQLAEDKTIIENIPGANNHNGGRIAFGPDKLLYITTGDAQQASLAQDTNSLAGKILRITDEGAVPLDNPFNNAVYSYGHRNPQGLAWDSEGRLWSTEHGRSGTSTGLDELNLIKPGANYGWPTIAGDETADGMQKPIAHSGPNTTWAPSGMAIFNNTMYFAGLRGQAIYQAKISADSVGPITSQFFGQYGRLRAITIHDGYLYFSTSNRDGRGRAKTEDDRILRIKLSNYKTAQ
jgi:glucose/arabinose dehydrogenase